LLSKGRMKKESTVRFILPVQGIPPNGIMTIIPLSPQ